MPRPWNSVGLVVILPFLCSALACIRGPAPVGPSSAGPGDGNLAAEQRLQSVERVDLLGPGGIAAFQLEGEVNKVALTTVSVSAQPFGAALHAAIREGSGSEWGVQLVAANAQSIEKGDLILATIHLRAPAPPEGAPLGQTEFVFELGRAPYSKSVQYPVEVGGEWTKVHIRFTAAQAYAPGEAHMIFRLGYPPETIEIGGATVISFGKRIPLTALPSTQGADRERARLAAATEEAAEEAAARAEPTKGGELAVSVAPNKVIRPISPYVYGVNAHRVEDSGATLRRLGGNRATGYNWENNASNAGNDYHHNSDDWSCTVLGYRDCDVPAAAVVNFAAANRKDGLQTIITIPMVDYVAADKKGEVKEAEAAPSGRWVKSLPTKPGPFAADGPDLEDGVVYQDELVNHLVGKVGKAKSGGVRFYSLDNEPALWPSTHPRIHPGRTTYAEISARTEATAAAITKVDPGAVVLGGVMFGWSEFLSLNEAPDFQAENAKLGMGATYIDFLLSQMKRMEGVHKRRLVHALDVHWYPEARGRKRITENDVSLKTVAARLQAPRSLWDPTYVEKSWIAASWGKPIRLIPWLRERIAARYPGTALAITEYDFGAGNHVSGGLAQADALGVFGREGVELATYWGGGAAVGKLPPYVKAAFQLYRNYDGKGATFGDTAVEVTGGDPAKASVFAATDSQRGGALTVVVINKNQHASYEGRIAIGAPVGCDSARVFVLQAPGPELKALPPVAVTNGTIAHRLPPLSATLFACGGK
ncbi:MAG: glycoside hydrolase family 44 protein [Myxococcales bacterium]